MPGLKSKTIHCYDIFVYVYVWFFMNTFPVIIQNAKLDTMGLTANWSAYFHILVTTVNTCVSVHTTAAILQMDVT